jgi:hypothetical protein
MKRPKTPEGKPHFRYVGKQMDDTEIYFLLDGFNIKFRNSFGSDHPDPEGTNILYEDFDRVREESKQINPEYGISEHDKLVLLEGQVKERLDCPISRAMRIAYEDVLELIEAVKHK